MLLSTTVLKCACVINTCIIPGIESGTRGRRSSALGALTELQHDKLTTGLSVWRFIIKYSKYIGNSVFFTHFFKFISDFLRKIGILKLFKVLTLTGLRSEVVDVIRI